MTTGTQQLQNALTAALQHILAGQALTAGQQAQLAAAAATAAAMAGGAAGAGEAHTQMGRQREREGGSVVLWCGYW